VIEFMPGDLVEETVNNEVVAYYIILATHYLHGFSDNPMLGYYSMIIYSTGHALPMHSPGSNWFIKHSDLQVSDFKLIVRGIPGK
jgi:hypothetical protein